MAPVSAYLKPEHFKICQERAFFVEATLAEGSQHPWDVFQVVRY